MLPVRERFGFGFRKLDTGGRMSRALFLTLMLAPALGLVFATRLDAQELELTAYGFRAGVSLDDDLLQLLVGGQADLGRIATNVRLQPLMTVGVGSDALTLFLAGEGHYLFPVEAGARFQPYAGGGLALHHIDHDVGGEDTELALSLVGGADVPVERWWGYFVEGRFVIADESIFRLEGGVNWQY
jgi:hypothetical protein